MPDIHHLIQIAARPETVYPLIATAAGFGKWWATDVSEAGGLVTLGFFNRSTIYTLKVETAEPAVEVVWLCETGHEWSGTRISFNLAFRAAATVLRFSHAGWKAETDYFVSCNTTWGGLMFRLKAAAEGKSRGPLFLAGDTAY